MIELKFEAKLNSCHTCRFTTTQVSTKDGDMFQCEDMDCRTRWIRFNDKWNRELILINE